MEASENLLGHRTNSLALHRLKYYEGCAIIKLQYLRFETDNLTGTRQIAEKNVEKLLRMFEIEGCGNLEPEHRVAATIDYVLRKAHDAVNIPVLYILVIIPIPFYTVALHEYSHPSTSIFDRPFLPPAYYY
ncbi:unnamed protein product [Penicillium roqueforti FM164]|uniref:Uncharacterized protein n=1 Tax=Penicillium roqueforti (strain FM164) TaxID=1365484 RepID=W6QT50_PENRF|nr:unnamed protein product [Penicillium roqueforti FM164]